ncbi:MAG: T9SS type A sorting domain-containing protein [Candidatus Limimorpha sp.]
MKRTLFFVFALMLAFNLTAQTPGSPVESFGTEGVVFFDVNPSYDEARDVLVQPDGCIISLGATRVGTSYHAFISRHDANGMIDESFANNGFWEYPIAGHQSYGGRGSHLYEDGKILMGIHDYNPSNNDCDSYLVKFNPDGSLDSSFGDGGIFKYEDNGKTTALKELVVLNNGKINLITYYYNGIGGDKIALVQVNEDGTLDTSYGDNGIKVLNIPYTYNGTTSEFYSHDAQRAVVQPDGKILIMGFADTYMTPFEGMYVGMLLRLNEDGTLDSSFGENGMALWNLSDGYDFGMCVAMQSDGKIIAGGHIWKDQTIALNTAVAVTRYTANGTIDNSFGTNGTVEVEWCPGNQNYAANVIVDANDNISLVGHSYDNNAAVDIFVLNILKDGDINTNYGPTGMFQVCKNNRQNQAYDIAFENGDGGNLIISGHSAYEDYSGRSMIIGKYYSDCASSEPTITVTPNTISFLFEGGDIETKSYTLSGANLEGSGNIEIAVEGEYTISLDNANFSSSLNVAFTDGELDETEVFVRMNDNLENGTYNGSVTNVGGGASATVYLYGTVEVDAVSEIVNGYVSVWGDNGNIMVENNSEMNAVVSVYNVAGQPVMVESVGMGTNRINSNLNAGLYIVKVVCGNKEMVQRVVVK